MSGIFALFSINTLFSQSRNNYLVFKSPDTSYHEANHTGNSLRARKQTFVNRASKEFDLQNEKGYLLYTRPLYNILNLSLLCKLENLWLNRISCKVGPILYGTVFAEYTTVPEKGFKIIHLNTSRITRTL